MSREGRYSPLPLKLTDRCKLQKLQDLVVPKEMTLLNIIHAKQNLFAPQKMNFMRALMMSNCMANGYLLEEFYRL
jgi:hypothetical protein